jgi:maltose O-acetyltransferase
MSRRNPSLGYVLAERHEPSPEGDSLERPSPESGVRIRPSRASASREVASSGAKATRIHGRLRSSPDVLTGPPLPRRTSLASRLLRQAKDELRALRPWELAVTGTANLFPQYSFGFCRTSLLRATGLRIGARSRVHGLLKVTGPGARGELLAIGSETVISGPLHVDLGALVRIGDRVHIGHHVVLLTVGHTIGPANHRCGEHVFLPITIGDGAWIGSGVTILPGVSVGDGAVVAAGAVVARDVEPNTLVGGTPARLIRNLPGGSQPE